jgi:hypothetical protein
VLKEACALFAFAFLAALTMAPVACFARAVPPVRQAPEARTHWGQASSYHLETTIRVLSVNVPVRGASFGDSPVSVSKTPKFGGDAKVESGSNWSPRVERFSGRGAAILRRTSKHFNLETVPVTVLGRRFVFSRFTVNRRGVHGTLSTGF